MEKEKKIAEKIVEFIKYQNLDSIPKRTKKILRFTLLDWITVALAGQTESVSKIIKDFEKSKGGKQEALTFGLIKRLPAKSASFINGVTGHSLDYDDTHFGSLGHPSAVVIPAALAAADKKKCNAKEFKEAVLVGIEIAIRVGIWLGRKHYNKGFHITSTAGIFGSTVAVSRIYRLSKKQTVNAISIAASCSSGIKAQFGSMGKSLQVGIAAARGLEAAFMAKKGVQSITNILDRPQGYGETYSSEFNNKAFLNLGKKFFLDEILFKFHACCHGTHSAIEALIFLRDNYQLKSNLIEKINIIVNKQYLNICNLKKPKTGLEIKFSYKMLAALIVSKFNTTSLESYSNENCTRKKLLKICKKVNIFPSKKISETKTKVIIELSNGKIIKKNHDLLSKINLSSLEQKLFFKSKTLLGEQVANKLWYDDTIDDSLPSDWLEENCLKQLNIK